MQALTHNPTQIKVRNYDQTSINILDTWKARYAAYILEQDKRKIFWYMKVILVMTNVHMIISTFAMAALVDKFEYYIGFTVLIFFTNVMVHLVQLRSKVYVPVYYISLGLMVLIPVITYLITLLS